MGDGNKPSQPGGSGAAYGLVTLSVAKMSRHPTKTSEICVIHLRYEKCAGSNLLAIELGCDEHAWVELLAIFYLFEANGRCIERAVDSAPTDKLLTFLGHQQG